jgi:hypothetical protein
MQNTRCIELIASRPRPSINNRIQSSKDPETSQHQQNCRDRETLVYKILCLPEDSSSASGRCHGDECGWGIGLHR